MNHIFWSLLVLGTLLADPEAVDVCSALRRIDDLDGKIVVIRGEYIGGPEVNGLFGQCDEKMMIGGNLWPSAISIRPATVAVAEANQKEWDSASLSRLSGAFRTRCSSCKVTATLTGRLKSSQGNASYSDREGKIYHLGFGHLGVFGAELEILAATDIAVRP